MRLIGYRDDAGLPVVGFLRGPGPFGGTDVVTLGELVDAGYVPEELRWLDLAGILEADPGLEAIGAAATALDDMEADGKSPRRVDVAALQLTPAVARPGKIVCIGLNYGDHVKEQGGVVPDRPLLFSKFSNALAADGEPVIRPAGTRALDLEAELGVVIGRTARRVARADAWDHVAGYVALNDISARDWQGNKVALAEGERGDGQWLRAKGSDTFMPMSATFVSLDEVGRGSSLAVRSWRVGASGAGAGSPVQMQDGATGDLVFDIPALIEFVTASITLEPGDVVSTGTPAGVGVFHVPPVYLEPGDVAIVEVERVGRIESPICAADGTAPAGSPAARLLAARGTGRG